MRLPVMPPVSPMLSRPAKELPPAGDVLYEPKWDGFRCIVFRDGDEVELGSRNERPLTRYFPELVQPVKDSLPERCVVDGEVVIMGPRGLDFDALQLRLHPAASRVNKLAGETPAAFVAFDLLALGDRDLRGEPFAARRSALVEALAGATPPIHLTPASLDRDVALDWFTRFEGAGLDGVMAKPLTHPYRPGDRTMLKVKHVRTADCVVAGYRWHKDGEGVGSILLGLYDRMGRLHHVGVASSFTAKYRKELVEELDPLVAEDLSEHPWGTWAAHAQPSAPGKAPSRMPGGFSRWNAHKDLSFIPLRPERVAEVTYDQLQSQRFRRVAKLMRWRFDRDPSSCTYDQLDVPVPAELHALFGS